MIINLGYIDPSIATTAIQAIAGVVIAIAAVVAVAWRRAKKKVVEKLGLEEKITKEQEDEIEIIEDETAEETVKEEAAATEE